ncbi:MAG: sigma-54 dependent transcriptional regulator [Holophaga sp.]|nr:sigma-54 dependent transcriptional regulator [Holophaga sp.]
MSDSLYPNFGVLLVDDEPSWLRTLSLVLRSRAGINNLTACEDAREVLGLMAHGGFGLVLLDLNMPCLSGEALLAGIAEHHPEALVIIISGLNQLEAVVRCIKMGAFDYFVKTDEEERIVGGVLRAVRMLEMQRASRDLADRMVSREIKHPEAFAAIVSADRAMLSIFSYVESVAASPHPLAVLGESGTGKELLVQAAHQLSGCKGKLVAVNVAGLDDTVFADTLFGHVKGAFTGAETPRKGMVEEAAGGTLFLDEIGDLSLPSQVKLLRLLQEGEYFPLGSDQPRRLRARIIVATHQDLKAKEADGRFRKDLYYRLRTHHVQLPPLRQRMGDLALLVDHFLADAARTMDRPKPNLPKGLLTFLGGYGFPGNIRELKSMLYDAVSVSHSAFLSMERLVALIQPAPGAAAPVPAAPGQNPFAGFDTLPTFKQSAQFLVAEAMARAGNNQTLAARLLGISQPALNKRLRMMRDEEPGS